MENGTIVKFAEYLLHNPYWGVFNETLEAGDYSSQVDPNSFDEELRPNEIELIAIYNKLTPNEREALSITAAQVMQGIICNHQDPADV